MKDISTFCSKIKLKPELMYIKISDDYKQAIATDSFRLAIQEIPDILQELFEAEKVSWLNPKIYKQIVKEYNKRRNNLTILQDIVRENKVYNQKMPEFVYPDVSKIIPKDDELVDFNNMVKVNGDYFKDFIDLVKKKSFLEFDFSKLKYKESNKMLYYRGAELTLLVMCLN